MSICHLCILEQQIISSWSYIQYVGSTLECSKLQYRVHTCLYIENLMHGFIMRDINGSRLRIICLWILVSLDIILCTYSPSVQFTRPLSPCASTSPGAKCSSDCCNVSVHSFLCMVMQCCRYNIDYHCHM